MVTLQQFMNAWQGKKVPSRGGITGQCVSLVQHWAEDQGIGGTPVFPVPSAYLMAGKRPDAFTWVTNTPTGVPSPGDIVVFSNKVGGGHGHTGVVVSANTKTLDVFQQNDPMGSGASTKRYTYANVLGWLKFKQAAPVAQGVVMNTADGKEKYLTALHRPAESDAAASQWNGLSSGEADRRLRTSPEWQTVDKKVKDYDVLATQVAQLKQNPTKAELEAVVNQLKTSSEKVAELEKKVAEEQANRTEDTQTVDEAAGLLQGIKRLFDLLINRKKK
jgi:hypothetical protein